MLLVIVALLVLSFILPVHAQGPVELLLFGGKGHKTFLGCLNCTKYDNGSVCNEYGDQGAKYASESIWNRYGDFGSSYSDRSPWNKYASEPPAIVDRDGNFYGYMTSNQYNPKRTKIIAMIALTEASDMDLTDLADIFCDR